MLPTCYSIQNMYEEYASGHSNPYCMKHFKRLVHDRFPEVKASERTTFTECKECSMIRNAKAGDLSKEQRLLLEEQKRAHLLVQRIAREKYYKHIKKARENPQKYCSIIIDNMDQAKTNLPRLPSYHKGDVSLTRVHHHVTGILAHGQGKSYVFTWTDKFSCDSNITMNCLLRVFDDIAQQRRLPPTLFLQADNSAKDNRNFIIMGFLGSLVLRKMFKKVKLSFLMVGHTHEDVDQMFSWISIHIGKMAIKTSDTLHEEIQAAYHPQPTTEHLSDLWDYRALALQSPIQLSGHKSPHCFRFHLQEDRVIMSYKEWPLQRATFQQLDITDLARAFDAAPHPISTMPDKGRGAFDAMGVDLPKWKRCGSLTDEEASWWEGHLEKQRTFGQPTVPKLDEFGPFLTSASEAANTMPPEIADTIRRHVSSLTQESTIRTVRQRRR
ncbi:uncharacterized protein LOC134244642 [Saccostrea cucullata]|uniref:uncharacterized protein LOC134244642 n=1 Tax=Saccostrea cuccullata TaxID=36930 RepID=UPI002ED12611